MIRVFVKLIALCHADFSPYRPRSLDAATFEQIYKTRTNVTKLGGGGGVCDINMYIILHIIQHRFNSFAMR
jgi:hypothetical protein